MKIIEALKKLRVIEKRIQSTTEEVNQYASALTTERLPYGTEEDQKREVKSRLQSTKDLFQEYLELKSRIEKTNLEVQVEVDGRTYSLSQLLVIKRKMAKQMMGVYSALNTDQADRRLRHAAALAGQSPQVVRLFDESEKNDNLRKWMELYDNIDSRLEVINATTDLIE